MSSPVDTQAAWLTLEAAAVLALLVAGVVLLVQAKWSRAPCVVVNGRVVARGRRRVPPIEPLATPPRMASGAELGRLADVMRTGRGHLDAILTSQSTAARHLDSAEVALSRLISDVMKVMPPPIVPAPAPQQVMALAA